MVSAQQKRAFAKGMAKGLGALGVGLGTRLVAKAASGAQPTIDLNAVNPLSGGGGAVRFLALVGGLAVSGNAETGMVRDHKHSGLRKIIGYGLMAAVGASMDPDDVGPVPRQLTRNPQVAAQYAGWIPMYAPQISFPVTRPTPPNAIITDPATQLPRWSNVF